MRTVMFCSAPSALSSDPWKPAGEAQRATASHGGIGAQGFCTSHGAQKAFSNTPTLKDCRRHRGLRRVPMANAVVADHSLAPRVVPSMRRVMIALCPIRPRQRDSTGDKRETGLEPATPTLAIRACNGEIKRAHYRRLDPFLQVFRFPSDSVQVATGAVARAIERHREDSRECRRAPLPHAPSAKSRRPA